MSVQAQVVALAREVLGGNGVQADFHVAKQFCDMEAIYTYEVRCICLSIELVLCLHDFSLTPFITYEEMRNVFF